MMVFIRLRVCLLSLVFLTGGCTGGDSSGDNVTAAKPGNGSSAQPAMTLSPINFTFSVTQGDANPVHTVEISNTGNGTLDWSASTTASWLTLSLSSGKASANTPTTFTAMANLSSLTAGTYSGAITVNGDATNGPQAIPVTLIISPLTSSTSPPSSPPPSSPSPTTVSVGIAWDAAGLNSGGYYVHYGIQPPNLAGSCAYSQSIFYSLGALANASAPTATISGLPIGGTYYFAVSAYDGTRESPCSNEISKAM